VRSPTASWETLAATRSLEAALPAAHLRLRARDERRQSVDAAIVRDRWLRLVLRLKLPVRAMLAMVVAIAGLMLIALLIGLAIALMIAMIVVALLIGLLLHWYKARLLSEIRKAVVVLTILRRHLIVVDTRLRLILTELLLRRRDQAEIMFGMLIVILGRDGVAGRSGVSR